jgi:hypothetical protein
MVLVPTNLILLQQKMVVPATWILPTEMGGFIQQSFPAAGFLVASAEGWTA